MENPHLTYSIIISLKAIFCLFMFHFFLLVFALAFIEYVYKRIEVSVCWKHSVTVVMPTILSEKLAIDTVFKYVLKITALGGYVPNESINKKREIISL